MQKVKIILATTNEKLDSTLVIPLRQSTDKAILFIHGWKSNESNYIKRAKALSELGYTCLTFSLRGHGESEGDIHKLTRQDFINDITEAYDFLAKQEDINIHKIGVVGASFGAYLATLLTKRRPVKWLVLRVPANYPDHGFEDIPQDSYPRLSLSTKEWRHQPLTYDKTIALRAIHQYPHEILIIESEKDEQIPHQTIQNYVNAVSDKSKLTYKIIKDADHSMRKELHQQEFIDILVEWFKHKR